MPELTSRLMLETDVDAIHEIEVASFPIPWSRDALLREATANCCARYVVLLEDGVPVAYAGVWLVLDEGHITNIAVRPDRRGLGYGERVTRDMMQLAADTGVTYLTLEVRASNEAAKSLYAKLGFITVGKRKGYYADTGEDGLVMCCTKLPPGNPDNDPMLVRE